MRIRVITFDLDNTLWDVEPALLRAEEAQRSWLLQHRPGAVEAIDHDALWTVKKRVWKSHPELAHNVTALRKVLLTELQLDAGYTDSEARSGADAAFAAFIEERQRVELYSNALAVLEVLAQNYRLGALTNGNADVFRTDAGEYFDFAYLAEEVGASKPAPALFDAALERTGAAPREVLHVGDNPEHDVLGALDAGMRAVWLNADGLHWKHEGEPDAIIASLDDLPPAVEELQPD
ncbi:MAG: HAD-IA family hydrolase [Pseudomonadota bacterium]